MKRALASLTCGLALVASLLLSGCPDEEPAATLQTAAPQLRISPLIGGLGMTVDLNLRGVNTQWQDGDIRVDLGEDITIGDVTINGPNNATVPVEIADSAVLGYRPITVDFDRRDVDGNDIAAASFTLRDVDGFLVQPGGVSITPDRARLGETLTISVTGFNTILQEGSAWVDMGEDVYVNWVTVQDETHATASVSIDQRAEPGWRDVSVRNGQVVYTAVEALFIERSSIAIEIQPENGNQGEVLPFSIEGYNTHFDGEGNRDTLVDMSSSICVNEFWPDCQDTVEPGGVVNVLAPTVSTGTMRISNGAAAGLYDVRAYTVERDDFDGNGVLDPGEFTILEEVVLHEGFEVRPVPIDCNDNPGVGFSFSVSRQIDNDTCNVVENVGASAVFYTPLDPPCGNPPGPPVFPYDIDYVINPPSGGADCPTTPTCDAGPYVYLESELNTITLEKQENPFTGEIRYVPDRQLVLDDYKFGYVAYDLWAEGSEDPTQIPEFRKEDALFTLPSDFELLAPQLCNNFTHDPREDLVVQWTPGNTYDVAGMSVSWSTTDADEVAWQIITLPWDDGEHAWSSDYWEQMPEGGGNFGFGAGVGEPKWFFDFGDGPVGLENQGRSGLSYSGFMLVRAEGD